MSHAETVSSCSILRRHRGRRGAVQVHCSEGEGPEHPSPVKHALRLSRGGGGDSALIQLEASDPTRGPDRPPWVCSTARLPCGLLLLPPAICPAAPPASPALSPHGMWAALGGPRHSCRPGPAASVQVPSGRRHVHAPCGALGSRLPLARIHQERPRKCLPEASAPYPFLCPLPSRERLGAKDTSRVTALKGVSTRPEPPPAPQTLRCRADVM